MTTRWTAAAVFVVLAGCGGKPQPSPTPSSKGLADAMADTVWDTQVLREASAAANEVVRLAGDCEAARPIVAEAKAKLDAAQPRLRTVAGRTSLDALRRQVVKVEELCPPGS